jgi:predicted DNA-binding protein (UPF0251 family)
MPRPKCCRRIGAEPSSTYFKPRGVPLSELDETVLAADEFEAIRLADLEGLYHEAAAERMGVSRQTFGRIIAAARAKVAEALVKGMALRIHVPDPCPSAAFGRGRRCPGHHSPNWRKE